MFEPADHIGSRDITRRKCVSKCSYQDLQNLYRGFVKPKENKPIIQYIIYLSDRDVMSHCGIANALVENISNNSSVFCTDASSSLLFNKAEKQTVILTENTENGRVVGCSYKAHISAGPD